MSKQVLTGLAVACASVLACAATVTVGSASASTEVAYNNLNTVPSSVNGKPNEDTYSIPYFDGFNATTGWGGQVQTVITNNRLLKTITSQVDVFSCEYGEYQLENCYTTKPNKKFAQEWFVSIYEVGAGEEPGALVATASTSAKLHYRPTTNVTCPMTAEGKGFGPNCDVGGLLQTITFKKFTQTRPLPVKAIVLMTNKCEACAGKVVNVGTFTSYKEYNSLLPEPFVAEPPADSGVPAIGSNPLPGSAYAFNRFESSGWGEYQPVFKIEVK